MANVYDLLVIGGGSGGLAAAIRAREHGAHVGLVEPHELGGTCLNRGCVPKKLMWEAGRRTDMVKTASDWGIHIASPANDKAADLLNIASLKQKRDRYVQRLGEEVYPRKLERAGVKLIRGHARLRPSAAAHADHCTVDVSGPDGGTYTARHVLIATGSSPRPLPVPGASLTINSDGAFHLERLPRRAAIIGGGYIACEVASLWAQFGVQVTLLIRAQDGVLNGFDTMLREGLRDAMVQQGIVIKQCVVTEVKAVQGQGQGAGQPSQDSGSTAGRDADPPQQQLVVLGRQQKNSSASHHPQCACGREDGQGQANGAHRHTCSCAPEEPVQLTDGPVDCVLAAVGRVPNTSSLGLAEAGITTDKNGCVVTDCWQNVPGHAGLYAVGDVTGRWQLTPVAIAAGRLLADRLFGGLSHADDRFVYHARHIPTVVFSHPPVGTVGLTEASAVQQYGRDNVTVYTSSFTPLSQAFNETPLRTHMKLVCATTTACSQSAGHAAHWEGIVDKQDQTVLGVHIIGDGADEMLQGFAVAVAAGLTKADLDHTTAIHPTAAEELVTMAPWRPHAPPEPVCAPSQPPGQAPGLRATTVQDGGTVSGAGTRQGVMAEGTEAAKAGAAVGTVAPSCLC